MTEGAIKMTVHRMRERLRALFREEVSLPSPPRGRPGRKFGICWDSWAAVHGELAGQG